MAPLDFGPVLPHEPGVRARLHPAVRRDRAHQPVPVRREPSCGGGKLMAKNREIGKAGWGYTLVTGIVGIAELEQRGAFL